jgi:hypothetical protein
MNVKQVLIALGATIMSVAGTGALSGISRAQTADDDAVAERSRIRRGFGRRVCCTTTAFEVNGLRLK